MNVIQVYKQQNVKVVRISLYKESMEYVINAQKDSDLLITMELQNVKNVPLITFHVKKTIKCVFITSIQDKSIATALGILKKVIFI